MFEVESLHGNNKFYVYGVNTIDNRTWFLVYDNDANGWIWIDSAYWKPVVE